MKYNRHLFEEGSGMSENRDYATTSQVRELYSKLGQLEGTVTTLESQVNETLITETPSVDSVSPMVNFVDNSDFSLSHLAYSFATDPTTNYILAKWYARPQTDTGVYYINTTTEESAKSVRSDEGQGTVVAYTGIAANVISITSNTLQDGMPVTISGSSLSSSTVYYVRDATTSSIKLTDTIGGAAITVTAAAGGNITTAFDPRAGSRVVVWDTEVGGLATAGGYVVASPLASKYAFLGNIIYVKLTFAHKPKEFTITASTDVDTTADTITINNHGLLNETAIIFDTATENLPQYRLTPMGANIPLTQYKTYYVRNATTNTFKISTTSKGSALNLVGTGTGSILVKTQIKPGLLARVSLFENSGGAVFKGDKPTLTAGKIGAHTGAVTRDYILEVQMRDGSKFYSYTGTGTGSFTEGANRVSNTDSPSTVSATKAVSVTWNKIVGASRYTLYRRSGSGSWYLVGTSSATVNQALDYGGEGVVFSPPDFTTAPSPVAEQQEYQLAHTVVTDATSALSRGELIPVEINSSIQFPDSVSGFSTTGDQFVQVEFFRADGSETNDSDIVKNTLILDRVALSYVYGRWHPSSRDQSLTPDKISPTLPLPSGGTVDGSGTGSGGGGGEIVVVGGTTCVHHKTPILVWSDSGDHFNLPAEDIVVGDRLVSWDGEKLVPSKVGKIVNGISRMNYRLFADGNELLCSFSHRIISNLSDFERGTNAGRLQDKVVVLKDGRAQEMELEGLESVATPVKVITFKMQKGLENYVSGGIFSHNNKEEYPILIP